MKTYQVTLPDEFATFVDRMVAEEKFESVDHLVLYTVSQVEGEIARDDLIDKNWLRKKLQMARPVKSRRGGTPRRSCHSRAC